MKNIRVKLTGRKRLTMNHLGRCRFEALLDALEIIGNKASERRIPYNKVNWDSNGALQHYVDERGTDIFNATYVR